MALSLKSKDELLKESNDIPVTEEKNDNTESEVINTGGYNIVVHRQSMIDDFTGSQEVDDVVSTIDVYNYDSIIEFGNNVAEDISRCSDTILKSMDIGKINDSGELLKNLSNLMEKFDIKEISNVNNGSVFGKLFKNTKKKIEQILEKYNSLSTEVDKIYVELKKYENEIKLSNSKLDSLFDTNINYYQSLVIYILAGEQGINELTQYINELKSDYEKDNNVNIQMNIMELEQAKEVLEQRVMDLRIAENVAMQSIPMIKTMQSSNLNLIRKINSAFIITLPVFKQALTQAVLLKRQRIQSEALSALDKKTNELLLKNAQNTVEQSKITAQLAGGSSIKVETLEETWKIIVSGIEETNKIREDLRLKRLQDTDRLNKLKQDFDVKLGISSKK